MTRAALRLWLAVIVAAAVAVVAGVSTGDGSESSRTAASGRSRSAGAAQQSSVVPISIIAMNDVYEMTPVSGGKEGGLARLATLRQQVLAKNPNTFTILAGDLLSPSALGTAVVDGERLAGRQMVDVMNVLGLDFATFGNHEFDPSLEQLIQRLGESKFTWFSSNVTDVDGRPFPNVRTNVVFTVRNGDGKEVRIGMFGLTIGSNAAAYVAYRDPLSVAKEQVAALRDRVDVLIAVTHLSVTADIELAQNVPGIDLILGGHEHENNQLQRGPDFTPVFKADANARTVYVHELLYDVDTKKLQIDARLRRITPELADDPEVLAAVDRWVDAGFGGFRSQGFDPVRVVATVAEPLDGREASVRNFPTGLTDAVASSMRRAASGSELAMFNSGSIRIDDVIPPGEVTEYDVIRTLPFGGTVVSADMAGSVVQRMLDHGMARVGTGSYLQTANVSRSGGGWLVGGSPLDPARTYRVAVNDFLLSGREGGFDFLARNAPGIANAAEHGDVRKALIAELAATSRSGG